MKWDRIEGTIKKIEDGEEHLQRVIQEEKQNAATLLQQRWRFIKARLAPNVRHELKLRHGALRERSIIAKRPVVAKKIHTVGSQQYNDVFGDLF